MAEFCDALYPKRVLLEDYIHFMCRHSQSVLMAELKQVGGLKHKCADDVAGCEWTSRHFADRSKHDAQGRESVDFRIETLDTLHFNLYYLTDVGLRVQANADDDEKATDEDQEQGLVYLAMKRMADKIEAGRAKCFFERIDGGQSSKFTLCAAQQKEDKAEMFRNLLVRQTAASRPSTPSKAS